MRHLTFMITVVCALTFGAVTGPSAGRAQTLTSAASIDWRSCFAGASTAATPAAVGTPAATPAAAYPGLECGFLAVPIDYADPNGSTTTIGFARLKARDPARRIGSLVFDPGGPGGNGGAVIAAEAAGTPVFGDDVRNRFDLIGLDPRGVGVSTRVKCDPVLYNAPVSLFPKNEAEFQALVAHNQALGESCLRLTGPLLAHVDTVSAARDIESIRIALGEEQITYLGLSYGTYLGAQYAALYPDRVRAMALDGALDHDLSETSMLLGEATTYETEFNRFVAWCATESACALHGQDVAALWDRLAAEAETTPLAAKACADGTAPRPCRPTVTGDDMRLNAQPMLFFKEPIPALGEPGWSDFAQALAEVAAGDASPLSTQLAVREDDGAYTAGPAISCLDYPSTALTYEAMAAKALLGRVIAPRMRGASQTWSVQASCLGWPVPVVNPPSPLNVRGTPPILIVNAMYDPATAYPWAHGLLNQIEGSVLLTRDGDGHTSYFSPGRTRNAVDTYLIDGVMPPPNSVFPD